MRQRQETETERRDRNRDGRQRGKTETGDRDRDGRQRGKTETERGDKGRMFKFERLEVWKKAVSLYEQVALLSRTINQRDQYSLGEQIRRASLSISTNIAEGTGREGEKESRHSFNIAKGSVYEVVSLLHIMRSRGYIAEKDYEALYGRVTRSPGCSVAS
jgi:four helix bundle protein